MVPIRRRSIPRTYVVLFSIGISDFAREMRLSIFIWHQTSFCVLSKYFQILVLKDSKSGNQIVEYYGFIIRAISTSTWMSRHIMRAKYVQRRSRYIDFNDFAQKPQMNKNRRSRNPLMAQEDMCYWPHIHDN